MIEKKFSDGSGQGGKSLGGDEGCGGRIWERDLGSVDKGKGYEEDLSGVGKGKIWEMKKYLRRTAVGVCASGLALVWWCVLYPELCFPEDTYEVICEAGEGADEWDGEMCEIREIRDGLLQAENGQIMVKSRLLEMLRQYRK